MSVVTDRVQGRRSLRFESLDDILREAECVATHPGRTLGNWSVAEILDHLANSIRAAYEGPDARVSWMIRWILAPLIRSSVLNQPMRPGTSLPKVMSHFLPGDDPTTGESLEKLRTWIARMRTEKPPLEHPIFGKLSHDNWVKLHLRHAELHLSFILPDTP